MEFCIYCNNAIQLHHEKPCEHCSKFPIDHSIKICNHFVVDLDDDWGMARRSDKWKEAESALRKVACEEYGHAFFPGSPYTWKTYCRRCGAMPEGKV